MNPHDFPANGQAVLAELDRCRQLFIDKTADYGTKDDAFPAFRDAEKWGIESWRSAAARLGNKYVRCQNLLTSGNAPAVSDETVEDSLRDLAIYALIVLVLKNESGR